MTEFKDITGITKDGAVNRLIASVAMEEAALSHILTAEGDKIAKALELVTGDVTVDELMKINESVKDVLDKVGQIERDLYDKLKLVMDGDKDVSPPIPKLLLQKVGKSGETINGGVFRLEGDGVYDEKPAVDGKIDFGFQPMGTYFVTEDEAPAGYVRDEGAHIVVVDCGKITMDDTASMTLINAKQAPNELKIKLCGKE